MRDPLSQREHQSTRTVLRVVGPILLLAGVTCLVIGTANLFTSRGAPTLFWLNFVGLPLIFVGIVMTFSGFMGKVTRYMGREQGPAVSHTFNEIAKGTQPGVRDTFRAIREGLAGEADASSRACPACGTTNDADARFCDDCGGSMPVARDCHSCGEPNDATARFCDACGEALEPA